MNANGREMKNKSIIVFLTAIFVISLSGCSTTVNNSLRAMGESYQCEREARNRPNETQLLAECQTRLQLQREREDEHSEQQG